jgi:Protein of unknown function (DUF3035)
MSRERHAYVDTILRCALLGAATVALIGCQSVREAAGIVKAPPDEFAVVTKAPLVIPPDFNLRPPKPGAAPTNQSSATDSAQAALYGDDPAVVAANLPKTYSSEEKTLLANTGAASADHGIREQITADNKSMATADDSFTDNLLFGSTKPPTGDKPVDADAEHDKMVADKTISETPVQGQAATSKTGGSQEEATISKDPDDNDINPNDTGDDNKDKGGWFGGLFNGIW